MKSGRPRVVAFTLMELMVVIAIIAVLAALLIPVTEIAGAAGKKVACVSGLRQLGMASSAYLNEHDQQFFAYMAAVPEGKLWYFGLEPSASLGNGEGARELDATQGPLYPYIQKVGGVEICPAFTYDRTLWKPKFKGASFGYGYNTFLSNRRVTALTAPSQVILFGDCAQVNTFQPPASRTNPMLEEFYMIEHTFKTVHFRHSGLANFLFVDGHIEALAPAPETLDARLPKQNVGRITPTGSMQYLQ